MINLDRPSRLLRRRSNIEPPPFKPEPSPSEILWPLSNGLASFLDIRDRSFKSGERPSQCRRPPANLRARLPAGLARPGRLRRPPQGYSQASHDRWSVVTRVPPLALRRSTVITGLSPFVINWRGLTNRVSPSSICWRSFAEERSPFVAVAATLVIRVWTFPVQGSFEIRKEP